MSIIDDIRQAIDVADDPAALIAEIKEALHAVSPGRAHPVDLVRWVPVEKVSPNDYNPNRVASIEMGLLATSIRHDGYTQPVVTVEDGSGGYVIVDGFHRYFCMKSADDIRATTGGLLPIVVIDKPLADRMASTVRHNRARGKHSVEGMSSMVFKMLDDGMNDTDICNELGMEAEELLRLKHVTGFSKLWDNTEYRQEWIGRRQARVRRDYALTHDDGFK